MPASVYLLTISAALAIKVFSLLTLLIEIGFAHHRALSGRFAEPTRRCGGEMEMKLF